MAATTTAPIHNPATKAAAGLKLINRTAIYTIPNLPAA
jgi:hypothetical protein